MLIANFDKLCAKYKGHSTDMYRIALVIFTLTILSGGNRQAGFIIGLISCESGYMNSCITEIGSARFELEFDS
jgi:hypothetical protein